MFGRRGLIQRTGRYGRHSIRIDLRELHAFIWDAFIWDAFTWDAFAWDADY
jgi:hypothetical protein